jgi:hypothetical protein
MKVKITYLLPVEKEIEMSPVDYCKLHASENYILNGERVFPEDSIEREVSLSPEARKELNHFLFTKNK